MPLYKETTSGSPYHGHVTASTTAQPLTARKLPPFNKGVVVMNCGSETVYVGSCNLTADTDPTSGGYPIKAGTAVSLPLDDPTQVFIRSVAGGEDVAWIGS